MRIREDVALVIEDDAAPHVRLDPLWGAMRAFDAYHRGARPGRDLDDGVVLLHGEGGCGLGSLGAGGVVAPVVIENQRDDPSRYEPSKDGPEAGPGERRPP
jgi:hypothetical protein